MYAKGAVWLHWTFYCAAGELLGLSVTAGAFATIGKILGEDTDLPEKFATVAAMVAAGLIEGSSVGFFQWQVLKRWLGSVTARPWLAVTAAAAALGWFIGMVPPTFLAPPEPATADLSEISLATMLSLAAVLGLVLGTLFGGAQWLVLRHHTRKANLWISGNALAWSVAMAKSINVLVRGSAITPLRADRGPLGRRSPFW